jgi:hypothetical protein
MLYTSSSFSNYLFLQNTTNGTYLSPYNFHITISDLANLRRSVRPMIKVIATGWERAFARAIPTVLPQYAVSAGKALGSFHKDIEARARVNGVGLVGLAMLAQQLYTYNAIFKDVVAVATEAINTQQREINREFAPVIAAAMQMGYELCENESGESRQKQTQ